MRREPQCRRRCRNQTRSEIREAPAAPSRLRVRSIGGRRGRGASRQVSRAREREQQGEENAGGDEGEVDQHDVRPRALFAKLIGRRSAGYLKVVTPHREAGDTSGVRSALEAIASRLPHEGANNDETVCSRLLSPVPVSVQEQQPEKSPRGGSAQENL